MPQSPSPLSQDETNEIAALKRQFTEPFAWFANATPEPIPGEQPHSYRARLLAALGIYPGSVAAGFEAVPPDALRRMAAEHVAKAPAVARARAEERGEMRAVHRTDAAGRSITEYIGDPSGWMTEFAGPRFLGSINQNAGKKWVEGHWE